MDYRQTLKRHTVLSFEGLSCHIEEMIGSGHNAVVYKGWYPDNLNPENRHHVLVKELFPFHPEQKIRRDETGGILVEPEAEELWQSHRRSFEMGNQAHLKLLYDHPELMALGANLNSFFYNNTLYSVLGYTGGRSLQEELNREAPSLRCIARRMIALLDALEAFHKSGFLHLDISPDNIMLVGQEDRERIFLIDYNSTRELGSLAEGSLSRKKGYFAPETSIGKRKALGYPTDLYSVAAVFFRCVMGRPLTLAEQLRRQPPTAKESPLLQSMPQTVSAMVATILTTGLDARPQFRYHSIGQMRQAFQELLDRIDCVGVTHWSLWENGRKSVETLIRNNPSLGYLQQEDALYPIRLECGGSMTLEGYLEQLLSPQGRSGLILAQGGMGKTTLLLHTAMLRGRRYSPNTPAVFYISLNGWEKADTQYIRRQILMRLRFKKEENNFESAMHGLNRLLGQTLQTKAGEIPSVLLLLDGLNEVQGNPASLIQEINELSKLPGVRILAASRSQIPELELETTTLMPLHREDIESALGTKGLLIPQNQNVLNLLRTPLILSIYIRTGYGGKQLSVRNEAELMKAYLDSLLDKETIQLPEESPLRWQIDVALNYVLPAIAAGVKKKGRGLTERQLLKIVKKCRNVLHSWIMQKAFPQWIGHTRDIFHGTAKTDEWFAVIVHELLWQRFGMLTKDENGRYHIFHQTIGDYLAQVYRGIDSRTRKGANPATIVALIWCVLQLCVLWNQYTQGLFDEIERVRFGGNGPYSGIEHVRFQDAFSAVDAYLETPDDRHYQTARSVTKQVLVELPEKFALYEGIASKKRIFSYSDRYAEYNLQELAMSGLDEMILRLKGMEPQYLTEPFRGYVSGIFCGTASTSAEMDAIAMLCTLDVLTEYYHKGVISQEQITEAVALLKSMYQVKYDLNGYLYYHYFRDEGSQERTRRVENQRQSLEALANTFMDTVETYPEEVQDQLYERTMIFRRGAADWEDYTQEPIQPPVVPEGLILPDWLPEEGAYYYLTMDPVFLTVTAELLEPNRTQLGPEPLAYYTVCYGITREELFAYLDVLDGVQIGYEVQEQEGLVQVFVGFEGMDITVNWTQFQTVLIMTGEKTEGSGT